MLTLIKLDLMHKDLLFDMMDEWAASGEKIVPYSIRVRDYHDYDDYLQVFSQEEAGIPGFVPASTYFGLDTSRNILIGAVNIRHCLNESLLLNGGHIGDGVRPSERGKGYATKMIALALAKCKELGIDRVLMVCDKANIASAKTIIKNNGVLENEIQVDGIIEQRYWIDLNQEFGF